MHGPFDSFDANARFQVEFPVGHMQELRIKQIYFTGDPNDPQDPWARREIEVRQALLDQGM